MNGTAKQITISIGISSKFSLEAVEEIYSGINLACEKYNVDLVGGDTSTSRQGLIISVAVISSTRYIQQKLMSQLTILILLQVLDLMGQQRRVLNWVPL